MSDIFLSYASQDREVAKRLSEALRERGWSVWWDRKVPAGQSFDRVIEDALNAAKCVVVLWSRASVNSDWVKEEASEGARRKILIPALIERVDLPIGFRRVEAADLVGWPENKDSEFDEFAEAIRNLINAVGPHSYRSLAPPPASAPPPTLGTVPPTLGRSTVTKLKPWWLGMVILAVVAVIAWAAWRVGGTDRSATGPATATPMQTAAVSPPAPLRATQTPTATPTQRPSATTTPTSATFAATPTPTVIRKPVVDQSAQVVIFAYHRFETTVRRPDTEMTPEMFEGQMKMLKDRNIPVIGMQDFLAWKRGEKNIPPRSAIITFDDGWKSQYDLGWPIMKKYGYPLTLFHLHRRREGNEVRRRRRH